MRFGYACINLSIPARSNRRCLLKNATAVTLRSLIKQNLTGLRHILEYNAARDILLFRISSDVIPFASHRVNLLNWEEEFAPELSGLAAMIKKSDMTVSMHPGQYTILNSPRAQIVENALAELDYHRRFLDALGNAACHKIVLHVGGLYGDRDKAKKTFVKRCGELDPDLKRRLVIENDDRLFTTADLLELSHQTGLPMVFDYLHHLANPSGARQLTDWLIDARATWRPEDGNYKLHYADQAPLKAKGSHAQSINMVNLLIFLARLPDNQVNIMLEVKDKNLSVERVMSILSGCKDAIREL